jgi:hypothetical protein
MARNDRAIDIAHGSGGASHRTPDLYHVKVGGIRLVKLRFLVGLLAI